MFHKNTEAIKKQDFQVSEKDYIQKKAEKGTFLIWQIEKKHIELYITHAVS